MHATTAIRSTGATMRGNAEPHAHTPRVMRQTQAIMGLVLLIGTLCAYLVGPGWFIIPAFIGCGLIFAGTSGLCPMASLIARMPWNRKNEPQGRGSCCGGRCKQS